MRIAFIIIFLSFSSAFSFAGSLSTIKISFKTLSCNGSKGFASIDADKIVKIESVKCAAGDKIKSVYQILVTGEPGSGLKYRVFTTSEDESKNIMEAVDAYQADKRKSIRDSGRIIIDK